MSVAPLDPAQQAAVDTASRRLLILAGAGTGKTRTLTHRVARLIEDGAAPSSIVLVTFTNRAAKEMVQRLSTLLGPRASDVQAGTFHALAFRVLRRHGHVLGLPSRFSILDRDSAIRLMAETSVPDVSPKRLVEILSLAVNTGAPVRDAVRLHAPDLAHVAPLILGAADRFATRKAELGFLDFDDLLVAWAVFLSSGTPEAAVTIDRTAHVLVDEYQDTNRIQAEIAERLASNGSLAVVGDDAQSIFGFRGARHANIIEFARRADTTVHRLTACYRSASGIVQVANAVQRQNEDRLDRTIQAIRTSQKKPIWVTTESDEDEAQFIAQRIVELEGEGVPLGAQSVLHRAHRHVDRITKALDARHIPYRLRTGSRFFERPAVRDLLAVLRVVSDPDDATSWRRLLSRQPGVGAKTAEAVSAIVHVTPGPASTRLFHAAATASIAQHLGTRVTTLARSLDAIERAPKVSDAVRYAGDLVDGAEEVAPLIEAAMHQATLDDYLAEVTLEAGGTHGAKVEDAVTISTVHQAKGLEWSVVFVAHLFDGAFPIQGALDDRRSIEEERRLFYVAITRAKDALYLLHPASAERIGMPPSRFLSEIDSELLERWDVR